MKRKGHMKSKAHINSFQLLPSFTSRSTTDQEQCVEPRSPFSYGSVSN